METEDTTSKPLLARMKDITILRVARRLLGIWWLRIILAALVLLSLWLAREQLQSFSRFILDQDRVTAYISSWGILGPFVLWVLNFLQVIIAILPGHAIAIAAGYFYGLPIGFFILYSSTIIAGQLAFALARRYGRPLVVYFIPSKYLDRWDASSERHGFWFYFIGLLVPVFPTDVLTFIAGLSMLSTPKFILANLIGRFPYLLLMALFGSHGVDFLSQGLPLLTWIIILLILIALAYSWRYLIPRISRLFLG
ncbi:MAG: VTT domain-containing protein [Anaerolineae bacterium]|nr:VTT domain-containing protein [Anaerolineae bacterium]